MAIIRTLIGNVKGIQGDTGATGATGAQGEAATITVGTTTTAAYGTNASVTNSGTETDAVFDFVIPQGAPGDEITDASNLTLNEITASTAQYPTFSVQEQLKTVFGKIQKFLSDIRTNGLFKSNLVNGFTQTTAGVNALDAAAGKTLNDALTTKTVQILSNISNFRARRNGAFVYVSCIAGTYTLNSNDRLVNNNVVVTIPSGYRPIMDCKVQEIFDGVGLTIYTDGTIGLTRGTMASGSLRFSCCYLTTDAYPS